MSLTKFLNVESYDEKMGRLQKIKEKFISEGIDPRIAEYKAQEVVLVPEELEAIKLNARQNAGLRPSLLFYFENEKQIEQVRKFFNVSISQQAVKDSTFLIKFLEIMEELNVGS